MNKLDIAKLSVTSVHFAVLLLQYSVILVFFLFYYKLFCH